MAATQPNAIRPAPNGSADTEATKLMRQRVNGHPTAPLTTSNGSVASPIAGTKIAGGARISGGAR